MHKLSNIRKRRLWKKISKTCKVGCSSCNIQQCAIMEPVPTFRRYLIATWRMYAAFGFVLLALCMLLNPTALGAWYSDLPGLGQMCLVFAPLAAAGVAIAAQERHDRISKE